MKMPSPSRDKLISVARDLIIERGFSAMSVNDVCAATGVTKGSFFHHFSSKEALGEAVLETFWQDVQHRHDSAGYRKMENPLARLLGYVDHAIDTYQDPVFRSGCLLAVYASELRTTYPDLYRQCIPHFIAWKADLETLLRDAAVTCPSGQAFDACAWAELYISSLEGALILAKALEDPGVIGRVLTLFRNQLASLLSSGNS